MAMEQKDISKLPIWAQNKIGKLERDLASARESLAASNGDIETKISWCDGWPEVWHFIPDRAAIVFETDNGKIGVRIKNGELYVMADDVLVVIPSSANTVTMRNIDIRDLK
jgi:hypothetical protein